MVPLLYFTLAWFRLYEHQILRLWFRECWLSSLANVYIYSILTEKWSTLSNDAREGRKRRLKKQEAIAEDSSKHLYHPSDEADSVPGEQGSLASL